MQNNTVGTAHQYIASRFTMELLAVVSMSTSQISVTFYKKSISTYNYNKYLGIIPGILSYINILQYENNHYKKTQL